jgi:hypothetical protein
MLGSCGLTEPSGELSGSTPLGGEGQAQRAPEAQPIANENNCAASIPACSRVFQDQTTEQTAGLEAQIRDEFRASCGEPADFPVSIHAVSGYSGGGKTMILSYERGEAPSFEAYALGLEHKHVPEIERYARLARRPIKEPWSTFAQRNAVLHALADASGHEFWAEPIVAPRARGRRG